MSGPGYCFDCGEELDPGESICDACGDSFMDDADDDASDESCPECGSDNVEDFDGGAVCADCGFEGDE